LIRDLGNSDSIEESLAFHALNIAYNFINPKKTCLKETICNLLRLHDKLAKEEISISNKNFYGSFFLTTSDVEKIRAKKEVIDELLNSTTEKIFTTSPAVWPKDFPVSLTIDQNIRLIEQHISTLSEKQCEQILSLLLRQIEPILEAKATPSETTFCEKRNSDKRNALHVHALNDRWFFDFLTKLVQTIKNALGVKTSAELVLEHVVDETKQLGIK